MMRGVLAKQINLLSLELSFNSKGVGIGKKLHTVIREFTHDEVPDVVQSNAVWSEQLSYATALAANGAQVSTVPVSENLHPMIATINNHQVTRGGIKSDAPWNIELTVASPETTDRAQKLPITVTNNLYTTVDAVAHNQVRDEGIVKDQ
jgi:hypothetical protein